jgi:hypothetical protein
MCTYAEKAYFSGDHCAHCAARDEFQRLARINQRNLELWRAGERYKASAMGKNRKSLFVGLGN